MTITQLVLATHNQGKVEEFQRMLESLNITVISAKEFNLPEPEETEKTFIGNALIKAKAASKATGLPALADDSGLCIDALGGAPGVDSALWGITPQGQRDFTVAMKRVYQEVGGITGTESASFVAVLALVIPEGKEEIFEGKVEGHLCWPMKGDKGHGYDPIFIPGGYTQSFAELDILEKNKVSHRAKAVKKFITYMHSHE